MAQTTGTGTQPKSSIVKTVLRRIRRSSTTEALVQYWVYARWVSKGRPGNVASPHVQKQRQLKQLGKTYNIHTLVETGTYRGAMVEAMKGTFSNIYSIEFSAELYRAAQQRFQDQKHIHLLQGDSAVRLAEVVKELSSPALFWLDAHYSGGVTGHADLETPIVKEVELILSRPEPHVLVIDDARCFNGTHDYPTVAALCDQIKKLKPTYHTYVKYDAIIAEPTRA